MLIIEIAIFAFATCASPGPVNVIASISGAQNGIKQNLPFVLGASLGLSLVIFVVGLGVKQLLQSHPMLEDVLTLIGSVYMLYLAFKLSKADVKIDSASDTATIPSFYQGAALQIINPKAWLVSMAGLAMYLQAEQHIASLIQYILIFLVVCFISVLLWVYLGHLVATKLTDGYLNLFTKIMAGLLVVLISTNLISTFSKYI